MPSFPLVDGFFASAAGTLLFLLFGLGFVFAFNAKRFVETVVDEGVSEVRDIIVRALQAALRMGKPGLFTSIKSFFIRRVIGLLQSFLVDLIFRLWSGVFKKSPAALIYGALLSAFVVGLCLTPTWLFVSLMVILVGAWAICSAFVTKLLRIVRSFIRRSEDPLVAAGQLLADTSS